MSNNTYYGIDALNNNTGNNNNAFGAYSLYNNLDASNNIAVGSNTLFYNTTGNNNTALGSGSMCNNITGSLNVAIGSSALEGLTGSNGGSHNVAIGAESLYINTGNFNTAVGSYSALNSDGSYNTFLGANTSFDISSNHYQYSTSLGYNAKISGNNQIVLGGTGPTGYPTVIIPGLVIFNGGSTGLTGSNQINITDASNNNAIYFPTFVNTSGNLYNATLNSTSNFSYDPSFSTLFLAGGIPGATGSYIQLQNNYGGLNANVGVNFRTYSFRSAGPATIIRAVDNGAGSSDLQFLTSTKSLDLPAQVSMIVKPQTTGNAFVGIGNSTPSYTLDVSGNINCTGNTTINGLASYPFDNPSSYTSTSLVTKEYVDSLITGISVKASVLAATTSAADVSGWVYDGSNNITNVTTPLILDQTTIYDGSYVLIKDPSNNLQNGVYVWNLGSSTLTRRSDLQYGDDAASAYVLVQNGTVNGKTAWVQNATPAIVGINPLTFVQFYTFDYKLGNGLSFNNFGYSYLNVDNSLNFVNYLDSVVGPSGSNGVLNVGSVTNTLNIGNPTLGSNYFTNFLNGLTGPTGSFTYLSSTNSVTQSLTGSTGSFTYLSASQSFTGSTGSFTYLSSSNSVTSPTFIGNATSSTNASQISVTDATNNNVIYYPNFTSNYATASNNTVYAAAGLSYDPSFSTLFLAGGIPGATGSYIQLQNNFGGLNANVGVNFRTYSFRSAGPATIIRAVDNGAGSSDLQFLTSTQSLGLPAQVSMIVKPQTTGNAFVGIGTSTPLYTLDVSGNINCSGNISGTFTGTITNATNSANSAVSTNYFNNNYYPTFVQNTSGNNPLLVTTGFSINPDNGVVSASIFDGSFNGNATTSTTSQFATTATNATNATNSTNSSQISVTDASNNNAIYYPTFVNTSGSSSNNTVYTASGLSYDPSFSTLFLAGGIAGATGSYIQLQNNFGGANANVGVNFRTYSNRSGGPATIIRAVDNGAGCSDLQFLTSTQSLGLPAQVSMIVKPQTTGNAFVGIGNSTPLYTLDVSGNINSSNTVIAANGFVGNASSSTYSSKSSVSIINTVSPTQYRPIMVNNNDVSGNYALGTCASFYFEPSLNTLYINAYGSPPYGSYLQLIGNGSSGGVGSRVGVNFDTFDRTPTPASTIRAVDNLNYSGNLQFLVAPPGTDASSNLYSQQVVMCINPQAYGNSSGVAYIGIGTTTPAYVLDVSGNANVSGTMTASAYNSTSDYRIKNNVFSLDSDVFTVDYLRPVTYYNTLSQKQSIGFIAHEVQDKFPFLVEGEKDAVDADGNAAYQSLDYISIIPILVKEIQDLKKELYLLKANSHHK